VILSLAVVVLLIVVVLGLCAAAPTIVAHAIAAAINIDFFM
jgi:hypothetical protein